MIVAVFQNGVTRQAVEDQLRVLIETIDADRTRAFLTELLIDADDDLTLEEFEAALTMIATWQDDAPRRIDACLGQAGAILDRFELVGDMRLSIIA